MLLGIIRKVLIHQVAKAVDLGLDLKSFLLWKQLDVILDEAILFILLLRMRRVEALG